MSVLISLGMRKMTPRTSLASLVALITLAGCQADTPTNDDLDTTTTSSTDSGSDSSTDTDDSSDETTQGSDTTTDPPDPGCGDATVDPDEECDDGNFVDDDGCTNACTLPTCGDGIVQANEPCDAGPNNGPGQLCNGMCELNVCGDGDAGPSESCDDGNTVDDDACPNNCVLASCGNGVLDPGEQCEDGDDDPTDGCTNACLFPICGDGIVWAGHEPCDDGNPNDDDDCTTACEFAACGDGVLQGEEQCEDGNEAPNDGCFGCLEQRVLSMSAMQSANCVLLDTAAVRCWGEGGHGKLGYGNIADIGDNEHPFTAGDVDLGGAVVQIDGGNNHSCALLDGGGVRCWGSNYEGMLGYGHVEDIGDDEPAGAGGDIEVGGAVAQLAVGGVHTCVLLDTGAVRCWGLGFEGSLGYGNQDTIGDDELPTSVGAVDVGGVVTQLRAGGAHTCALLDSGVVRCWGAGWFGALGYGNEDKIGDDETPASAGDVGGVVVDIALGGASSCALLDTGAVRCWGLNDLGQLGYGHTANIGDDESPASAGDVELGGVAIQVAGGSRHTCALLEGGSVRCWGRNDHGQLGYANVTNIGDNEAPASVGTVDIGGLVESLSASYTHTCALLTTGLVRCWGWNLHGELGLGHLYAIGDNETPASVDNVKVF
jgi:cysteine-rich repeat protein